MKSVASITLKAVTSITTKGITLKAVTSIITKAVKSMNAKTAASKHVKTAASIDAVEYLPKLSKTFELIVDNCKDSKTSTVTLAVAAIVMKTVASTVPRNNGKDSDTLTVALASRKQWRRYLPVLRGSQSNPDEQNQVSFSRSTKGREGGGGGGGGR